MWTVPLSPEWSSGGRTTVDRSRRPVRGLRKTNILLVSPFSSQTAHPYPSLTSETPPKVHSDLFLGPPSQTRGGSRMTQKSYRDSRTPVLPFLANFNRVSTWHRVIVVWGRYNTLLLKRKETSLRHWNVKRSVVTPILDPSNVLELKDIRPTTLSP